MSLFSQERTSERQNMIQEQLLARGIRDERVLQAMGTVPREEFVPDAQWLHAYEDRALSIGCGQTISQPYMVAIMLQALQIAPNHVVLEVGAGSGYQAALLGYLARRVYAVEIVPDLAAKASQAFIRLGFDNVHIICADGSLGYPDAAPYDRIIVAAAAPEIPQPLIEQLADNGRLIIPVGPQGHQECLIGVKTKGKLVVQPGLSCTFVPLRGQFGWQASRWPGDE